MGRLTFDGNFCDIAQCAEIPGGSYCEDGACSQKKVWERLKIYEDMGLTPEEVDFANEAAQQLERLCKLCDLDRLEELAEADKDGRVVVLPCRVGDDVWVDGRIAMICSFFGYKKERYFHAQVDDYFQYIDIPFSEIGKTVFLTREEAEQALERSRENAAD